jgi:hypothetical protein
VHDSEKWGAPQQGWTILDKTLWLLHVLAAGKGRESVSGPSIAATFNKLFRQSGTVHPPLVTRELGKSKIANPALVGEDSSAEPSNWFLTNEGIKRAEQLVSDTKGKSA